MSNIKAIMLSDSEDQQTNIIFNYIAIYLQVDERLDFENILKAYKIMFCSVNVKVLLVINMCENWL